MKPYKKINLITEDNVTITRFPDKQPHIQLMKINKGDDVDVVCSLNSPSAILELLMCCNALDNLQAEKSELQILYLMGARYDRLMKYGDSFDLKVICNLINSLNFKSVKILDPHSNITTALINNSIAVQVDLLNEPLLPNDVVIIPDAGATKKIEGYIVDSTTFVQCLKKRDESGNIKSIVLNPELCKNKRCFIIDDLCDGGMTFIKIAQQINPSELHLCVTHSIFSHGTTSLREHFTTIRTTDSYSNWTTNDFIKVTNITDGI